MKGMNEMSEKSKEWGKKTCETRTRGKDGAGGRSAGEPKPRPCKEAKAGGQRAEEQNGSLRASNTAGGLQPDELPGGLRVEDLDAFLAGQGEELITEPRPFAAYMRQKLREKGLLQQNLFLAADLSEGFGYKLIAEEKRTRQRDLILRLCFAARFSTEELQEALLRYGMAPLWRRFPRDAVLLAALGSGIHELQEVNRLLARYGQPPLLRDYE